MKNRKLAFMLSAPAMALGLSACNAQMDKTRDIRAPAANVVGEPVSCLTLSQVQNTTVYDDYTIDFETAGGKLYRNTLPHRCPSLGFERAFSYQTSVNQLCNSDIIYALRTGAHGPERGAACGLGEFVPIELAPR